MTPEHMEATLQSIEAKINDTQISVARIEERQTGIEDKITVIDKKFNLYNGLREKQAEFDKEQSGLVKVVAQTKAIADKHTLYFERTMIFLLSSIVLSVLGFGVALISKYFKI